MHREISYADQKFQQESRLFLYAFTALIGLLLVADLVFPTSLWRSFAEWSSDNGVPLPKDHFLFGYQLALYAAVLGGARVLYGSLDSLLQGRLGADLALAIACIAAILFEKYDVAAEVVFIGLLGECLEHFTFGRTQRALRQIVEICPRRCWRLREGREERVLTSELQVGDRIVVKPGARVPADGVVIEGRSAVDVSALTGESVPVDKGPGDEVLAGALNQFGALTLEAKRVAEQTVVGRVIELTARALQDKAPLERTADRLARYFLPVVLGIAFMTFTIGFVVYGRAYLRSTSVEGNFKTEVLRPASNPALAVLVVACPCALILATPAAVIAAMGRLAGTGVLLKRGAALERLAAVRAFAFDKTGTLTEGKLELGEVVPLSGMTREELLRTAAAAEQKSEHALAKLIIHEAARLNLTPDPVVEFQAHPGSGVVARTATATILVGNRRLLAEQGVALSDEVLALLDSLDTRGQTVLLVARDGQVLGAIGARDRIRPEAAEVLTQLRNAGVTDMAMLTGDRAAAAYEVAAALGITEVHAELLPAQKAAFIADWQKKQRVAMVGDGINDAPALACADVGLAIGGSGTDIAAEAGDIVLMGEPLRHLPLLVRLSRQTVTIIKQNILVFAFGVNALGILLVWLWQLFAPQEWADQGPVIGVVYHQVGSLLVLLNSMRLLWFDRTATSPALHGVRQHMEGLNHWLEHRFDLDEALHTASHHWRKIVAGVTVFVLATWFASGLTQINAEEVGLVRRFGRALPEDLEPGLAWRWPWPIETVTKVQPRRVQTVEIGFRTVGGGPAVPAARSWSSAHGNDGLRRVPDEAVMMTGDGNLIELQATVRYRISKPHVYLFAVADAPNVLRSAAEAVLRERVSGETFAELLTADRARFHDEVLQRLQNRCAEYGPDGLGVSLDGIALHDLHPPQEVVSAYHAVTKAMEARDRRINDAYAAALRRERDQEGKNLEVVRQAQAAKQEKIALATARQAAFLARYQARTQLSLKQEGLLLLDLFQESLRGRTSQDLEHDYLRKRADLLKQQADLVDFRLYWEMLTVTLAGREKVVIDADQVPGRRHLFLMPLEPFRMMLPPALPPRGEP
jgi:P-type Cu+ transporter